jgi:hypothetical protein
VAAAVRWSGRLCAVAATLLWLTWLVWRVVTPIHGFVGVIVLVLEVLAFGAALVISAALWRPPLRSPSSSQRRAARRRDASLPETFAAAVGLDQTGGVRRSAIAADDTGEVAWARHGLRRLSRRESDDRPSLAELAWSVVALEGMRRMLTVGMVVIVLFAGWFPFDNPPILAWVVLIASQLLVTAAHYLLSDGLIRPGTRLRWSMASVGAGFGDGRSRTGLPIRWTATLATIVALNLVVSLRGLSDRWTHGLGAMPHDERVVAMAAATWLVGWGFMALRALPQPDLGYYGATRRLEEASTRRLALGATLTVAAIGVIAGVLPGGVPA